MELRKENNLLQKDVANVLDVTRRAYSFWEAGREIIPLTRLNKLCNYYQVSLDYMLLLSEKNDQNVKMLENLNRVEIGKRIRKVREINNISLRKLAKELDTTASTISAYENGKTLILTSFAYQICKNYHISIFCHFHLFLLFQLSIIYK